MTMNRNHHPTRLLVLAVLFLSCDLQQGAGNPRDTDTETKSDQFTSTRTVPLFDNTVPIKKSSDNIIHDVDNDANHWMVRHRFVEEERRPPPPRRRSLQISGSKTGMTCVSDTLLVGEVLHRNEAICDTIYDAFGLDEDGSVVWLQADEESGGSVQTLWQAPFVVQGGADVLTMQSDGNLG
jgi:hypothetical protein